MDEEVLMRHCRLGEHCFFLSSFPFLFTFLSLFLVFPSLLPFLFSPLPAWHQCLTLAPFFSLTHPLPSLPPRYTHRRDFDFDDTLKAMVTMFEVLTLEGWLDVRDMLVRDPVSPGIPSTQEAWVS